MWSLSGDEAVRIARGPIRGLFFRRGQYGLWDAPGVSACSSSGVVETVPVLFKAPPKPAKQMSGERVEAMHDSKMGELML